MEKDFDLHTNSGLMEKLMHMMAWTQDHLEAHQRYEPIQQRAESKKF